MTIKDAIDILDELKPNAFGEEMKCRWLSELEGRIQTEVLLHDAVEAIVYQWPEDEDSELLIGPPYDQMYTQYLACMTDLANMEYDKYQNSQAVFEGTFKAFRRWFVSKYRPADRPGIYRFNE